MEADPCPTTRRAEALAVLADRYASPAFQAAELVASGGRGEPELVALLTTCLNLMAKGTLPEALYREVGDMAVKWVEGGA